MSDDEKRAAYLAAKRMLAEPVKRTGLFDEPDGREQLRRSVLVRLVQRMEPTTWAGVEVPR